VLLRGRGALPPVGAARAARGARGEDGVSGPDAPRAAWRSEGGQAEVWFVTSRPPCVRRLNRGTSTLPRHPACGCVPSRGRSERRYARSLRFSVLENRSSHSESRIHTCCSGRSGCSCDPMSSSTSHPVRRRLESSSACSTPRGHRTACRSSSCSSSGSGAFAVTRRLRRRSGRSRSA
jgi:hypothetical protein